MENSDNNTSRSSWLCMVSSVSSAGKESVLDAAWMLEPSVPPWENDCEAFAICDPQGWNLLEGSLAISVGFPAGLWSVGVAVDGDCFRGTFGERDDWHS